MPSVLVDIYAKLAIGEVYMCCPEPTKEASTDTLEATQPEGWILGTRIKDVTIVRDIIPHYNESLLMYTLELNPENLVVGWFTCSPSIKAETNSLQRLANNVSHPVCLVMRPPTNECIDICFEAYIPYTVQVSTSNAIQTFIEIQCDTSPTDLASVEIALGTITRALLPTANRSSTLVTQIESAISYIEKVIQGEIKGDEGIGKQIAQIVFKADSLVNRMDFNTEEDQKLIALSVSTFSQLIKKVVDV